MISCSINKNISLDVVSCAYSTYEAGIIMISGFATVHGVKAAARELKKKCDITLHYRRFVEQGKDFTVNTSHMQDSEYSHIMIFKKDQTYVSEGKEKIRLFIFAEHEQDEKWSDLFSMVCNDTYPQKLLDLVYDKLYKMCPVPILPDWTPYLLRYFINENYIREAATVATEGIKPMFCAVIDIAIQDIVNRLQTGLENGLISIGDGATSPFMKDVEGVDAYLTEFSEVLSTKIQNSFTPFFIPEQQPYDEDLSIVYDYIKHNDKISLYPAQMAVAQAITNAFNNGKRACFVIAECGSGI